MKKDVLDINGLSDTIKLNRFVVHSECKAKVVETIDEDGKVISKRNAVTVVDENKKLKSLFLGLFLLQFFFKKSVCYICYCSNYIAYRYFCNNC